MVGDVLLDLLQPVTNPHSRNETRPSISNGSGSQGRSTHLGPSTQSSGQDIPGGARSQSPPSPRSEQRRSERRNSIQRRNSRSQRSSPEDSVSDSQYVSRDDCSEEYTVDHDYKVKDKVQVRSTSRKGKWFKDGVVDKIATQDTVDEEGKSVRDRSVHVIYDKERYEKWVTPSYIKRQLKHLDTDSE